MSATIGRGAHGYALAPVAGCMHPPLYLWHWPTLVLPVAAIDGELPMTARLGLAAFAVVVAWGSWRFIEEPFRAGLPVLTGRPGRTILAGGAAVALVVSAAGGLAAADSRGAWPADSAPSTGEVPADVDDPPVEIETTIPVVADGAGSSGSLTDELDLDVTGPDASAVPVATPSMAPTSSSPAATPIPTPRTYVRLPAGVRPTLAGARSDEERLRSAGCLAFEGATRPPDCVYGDKTGSTTVALVGDSHASQWFPALERVAKARDWRLLTFVKVACPFLDMRVANISLKREYTECAKFNAATIARLRQVRPDLTLVSMSRFAVHPILDRDSPVTARAAAVARMLEQIPGRIAVIVDTPDGGRDIPACLARHVADVRVCAVPRATAYARSLGAIERAATESTGADLIDLTKRVCRGTPCPVVVDGMIVFRDLRHLTATFSRSLAPDMDRVVASILGTNAVPSPDDVP